MVTITLKAAIAIATALIGACLLRSRGLAAASDRSFLLQVLVVQVACSLALFVGLYVIGHQQVTSDVPSYYIPEGRAALSGSLPYRDFASSYAPLFPYISGALLSIWNSGKIFALWAIGLNAATLGLWHWTATACISPATARRCSIFFATSGHIILQALLGVQQIWVATALAVSAWLLIRHREVSSGLVQALSLCVTKFLVVLFWPLMAICAFRRLRWLAAALVPSVVIYAAFALHGADPMLPLRSEGGLISSGNLPYLIAPLLKVLPLTATFPQEAFFDGIAVLSLAIIITWLYAQSSRLPAEARSALLITGIAITGLVFMLTSKKSFTGYEVFFMYPVLCVLQLPAATPRSRGVFLAVFNVLLATEPSLWFHLHGNGRPLTDWWHDAEGPALVGFLLTDVALVGCYGYILSRGLRYLRMQSVAANAIVQPTGAF